MFFGTIHQTVSRYLAKEIKEHDPKVVHVLFAGNFIVEQLAAKMCPSARIESTDVSIYSRAIGFGVSGKDFRLKIKPELEKDFGFLATKIEPIEKSAVVIMFSEIAKAYLNRNKIAYYEFQYQDAVNNQEKYFNQVMKKLIAFRDSTKMNFHGVDACLLIPNIEKGDFVFYDPPIILGDYEKMFKALTDCLDFDEVEYMQMTEEIKQGHLKYLNDLGANVYYRTTNQMENVPEGYSLVFNYQYKWEASYCIYANSNKNTFVGTFEPLKEEIKNYPIIGKNDIIDENSQVEIIRIGGNIANHYRIMWVKKAQMSNGGMAFLVTVDKKIIGILQLMEGVKLGTDYVAIFSDPAAPTSRYKRLSKLIIYLCCTKTVLKIVNDISMWPHIGFTTRVFTNEPVSMKYRGLFHLAKREKSEESDYQYKLIYQNKDKIFENYQEALKKWLKEHGKITI